MLFSTEIFEKKTLLVKLKKSAWQKTSPKFNSYQSNKQLWAIVFLEVLCPSNEARFIKTKLPKTNNANHNNQITLILSLVDLTTDNLPSEPKSSKNSRAKKEELSSSRRCWFYFAVELPIKSLYVGNWHASHSHARKKKLSHHKKLIVHFKNPQVLYFVIFSSKFITTLVISSTFTRDKLFIKANGHESH